jgi:hypothetical protein
MCHGHGFQQRLAGLEGLAAMCHAIYRVLALQDVREHRYAETVLGTTQRFRPIPGQRGVYALAA